MDIANIAIEAKVVIKFIHIKKGIKCSYKSRLWHIYIKIFFNQCAIHQALSDLQQGIAIKVHILIAFNVRFKAK